MSDQSGQTWLSSFNDVGEQLMGKSANELHMLKQQGDEHAFEAAFQEASFKSYLFRVRAKQENYQDEMKVRCQVLSAAPIDYVKETKHLMGEIKKYLY